MKYLRYILIVFITILFLPLSGQAYEYQNKNNAAAIDRYVKDIDDLKEMYDDLIIEEEEDCDLPSSTVYAECSGVTVDGQGTYSLEDYVAGVLSAEFGITIDNDEAAKAFGIAARSYVMYQTHNCKKSIDSSTNMQQFAKNGIEKYRKYAKLSEGQVMTRGKKIVCGYYALSYPSNCEEGAGSSTCTIKRCKTWSNTISACKNISTSVVPTSALSTYYRHSHISGLEPYISRYYANKEGYSSEQILKHFYGDDIKISTLSGVDNSEQTTGQDDTNSDIENQTETTTNTSNSDILVDTSKYKFKTKKLMVTTYTGSASENGGYAGRIALSDVNGGKLADGMVAVRLFSGGKTWIPYHTVIYVETHKKGEGSFANGKFFYVADNGGLKQDEQIDVYCAECDAKNNPKMAYSAPYGTYYNGKLYIVKKNVSWEEFQKNYFTKKAVIANSTESDEDNSCTVDSDDSSDNNSEYVNVNGVTFKVKNYNIEGTSKGLSKYFNLNTGNVSQCPWYAKYRAIEIIMSSSLSKDLKNKAKSVLSASGGHGNNWYAGKNRDLEYFKYSNDVTKPKAGSIVSWNINRHGFGHVGIIEKVYSDGSVLLSEGWNRFGENSTNGVNAIKIVTRKVNQEYLKTYGNQGSFIGYTYLFSYKK